MELTTQIQQMLHCPIVAYHHFVETPEGSMQYATTSEKLTKDMTTMLENGYTSISLRQRHACAAGLAPWPEKPFICTMDDGYESNYRLAFPILKDMGIHIDIFVVTDLVGARPESGTVGETHFTWEQAREMEESGYATMQAHGKLHLNNVTLSMEAFHDNVFGSIAALEENLGKREYIAYAHPCAHYQVEKFAHLHKNGVQNQMMNFWMLEKPYMDYNINARMVCGFDDDILSMIEEYREGIVKRLSS